MKNFTYCILLGGVFSLDAHTTYVIEQPEAERYIEVESAPPAEFEEAVETSPGAEYGWVKGHWRWNGSEWVRAHGYWTKRPLETVAWEPGYWKYHDHHHHWKWHEGRWK